MTRVCHYLLLIGNGTLDVRHASRSILIFASISKIIKKRYSTIRDLIKLEHLEETGAEQIGCLACDADPDEDMLARQVAPTYPQALAGIRHAARRRRNYNEIERAQDDSEGEMEELETTRQEAR